MNRTRKDLVKKARSQYEVRWKDVLRKARVPKAHRTTAKRSFDRLGLKVAWRPCREKPQRTKEQKAERVALCAKWSKLPKAYFADKVDLVIDNKTFAVPTTPKARAYLKQRNVRGHLRTPSEGLREGCAKPGLKRNRMNTGGSVSVCAGIANSRIVTWQYLPKNWSGEAAKKFYTGPIMKALRQHRATKRSYKLLEDNDPTGYKSSKGKAAKRQLGLKPMEFPRYSPDLKPSRFLPLVGDRAAHR